MNVLRPRQGFNYCITKWRIISVIPGPGIVPKITCITSRRRRPRLLTFIQLLVHRDSTRRKLPPPSDLPPLSFTLVNDASWYVGRFTTLPTCDVSGGNATWKWQFQWKLNSVISYLANLEKLMSNVGDFSVSLRSRIHCS